ncbi:MAG: efflux RND transporter periplasmic adaptor subunit [Roseomonas sp.]|nr:efflux RND transporter periplasmic adaptor subunit [Roseomonas sp.]
MTKIDWPRAGAEDEKYAPSLVSTPDAEKAGSINSQAAAAEHKEKRPWPVIALLAILLAGSALGFAWHAGMFGENHGGQPHRATGAVAATRADFPLSPDEVRSLRIAPVGQRQFRDERIAEGQIAVNEDRTTPVFTPNTGRVVRVFGRLGDIVMAGQPLFEIETADLVQATNDLLGALDGVSRAQTALQLNTRNEQRQKDLFEARAASRRDWEQAQAEAANAAADLRVAETQLSAARDRLRILGRDADQVARIEQTRRVEAAIQVAAPIGGVIALRRVGPGQWLTTGGSEPAFTIADLSTMWLVAAVREMDAPLIRVGQAVEVTVNALPGHSFNAKVSSVGASLDPATRRLPVRAEVEDPAGLLKAGMFARFRIVLGDATAAPAVPGAAIIHRGPETAVWVAKPGRERFSYRKIELGRRLGDYWEVTAGLAAGEEIVTGGALFIDRAAPVD